MHGPTPAISRASPSPHGCGCPGFIRIGWKFADWRPLNNAPTRRLFRRRRSFSSTLLFQLLSVSIIFFSPSRASTSSSLLTHRMANNQDSAPMRPPVKLQPQRLERDVAERSNQQPSFVLCPRQAASSPLMFKPQTAGAHSCAAHLLEPLRLLRLYAFVIRTDCRPPLFCSPRSSHHPSPPFTPYTSPSD